MDPKFIVTTKTDTTRSVRSTKAGVGALPARRGCRQHLRAPQRAGLGLQLAAMAAGPGKCHSKLVRAPYR